jgi:hypothetical protein
MRPFFQTLDSSGLRAGTVEQVRWCWGAFVGPLIAVAPVTCSVGNVPLAAVLRSGGISFGGLASFIVGHLTILPIRNIHRTYYGAIMTVFLAVAFYMAMVAAALASKVCSLCSDRSQQHGMRQLWMQHLFAYRTILDTIFGVVVIARRSYFSRPMD